MNTATQEARTDRTRPGTRAVVVLICLLALVLVVVEVGARVLVRRISKIEGRIGAEYAAALKPPASSAPVALFVGNSLLDAAVDFPAVRSSLRNHDVEARRFVVEQTTFHDWHYALRRLFSDGARPRFVVLMLNANQLLADNSRGEYSAHTLVNLSDVLPFASDLNVHPTNAGNLLFSNISMFYGLRSEIRKVLIGRLMPNLTVLTNRLVPGALPEVPDWKLRDVAPRRLAILNNECSRNGARLIFAIAPNLYFQKTRKFEEVCRSAGIEVLVPYHAGDLNPSHFSDGFHLNANGARVYTARLIDTLSQSEAVMASGEATGTRARTTP